MAICYANNMWKQFPYTPCFTFKVTMETTATPQGVLFEPVK